MDCLIQFWRYRSVLIKTNREIPSSEITPESVYVSRRKFMGQSASAAVLAGIAGSAYGLPENYVSEQGFVKRRTYWRERLRRKNMRPAITTFYEFGTGKEDPSKKAHVLTTDPWSLEVSGRVGKPGQVDLEDILKEISTLEERIYRLRCVEAWSMGGAMDRVSRQEAARSV